MRGLNAGGAGAGGPRHGYVKRPVFRVPKMSRVGRDIDLPSMDSARSTSRCRSASRCCSRVRRHAPGAVARAGEVVRRRGLLGRGCAEGPRGPRSPYFGDALHRRHGQHLLDVLRANHARELEGGAGAADVRRRARGGIGAAPLPGSLPGAPGQGVCSRPEAPSVEVAVGRRKAYGPRPHDRHRRPPPWGFESTNLCRSWPSASPPAPCAPPRTLSSARSRGAPRARRPKAPAIGAPGRLVVPRTTFPRGAFGGAFGGGGGGGDGARSPGSIAASHSVGSTKFTFVFSAIQTELALNTSSFNRFKRRGMAAEENRTPSPPPEPRQFKRPRSQRREGHRTKRARGGGGGWGGAGIASGSGWAPTF